MAGRHFTVMGNISEKYPLKVYVNLSSPVHQSHLQPLFSMGLVLCNKLFHISTICTYVECVECDTMSPAVLF